MKYQMAVHITRADHWSFEDRERVPITQAEWLAYVVADPEFHYFTPNRLITETGFVFEVLPADEGYWEWLAYSQRPAKLALFQYLRGGIIVRAPDAEVLGKASAVAATLGAKVLSDELP
jgi:hypothetical protein